MPTSWPAVQPSSSPKIPSLSGSIFCLGLFSYLMLMQIRGLIEWSEFLGFSPWTRFAWMAFNLLMLTGFYGSYRRTIIRRHEVRHERFIKALETTWPELEPATDWNEIERAMGALMEAGVEPTFERAKNWLHAESAQKRLVDMIQLRATEQDETPEHLLPEWFRRGHHY